MSRRASADFFLAAVIPAPDPWLTFIGSNADADRNNARLCCDNEALEMRAIKPVFAGEEIFNDYGQLPRSDLLRRYGYVTENYKSYDVAEISTPELLSLFRSKEAFKDLNLNRLSQEDLDSRVSNIVSNQCG